KFCRAIPSTALRLAIPQHARKLRGFSGSPGVRPSSGAATPEQSGASRLPPAIGPSYDAAPEDGRTPGRLRFCSECSWLLRDLARAVLYLRFGLGSHPPCFMRTKRLFFSWCRLEAASDPLADTCFGLLMRERKASHFVPGGCACRFYLGQSSVAPERFGLRGPAGGEQRGFH